MDVPTLNERADGYRGLWYQREKLPSEYRYKYSGGLGIYCAKHQPSRLYFCNKAGDLFQPPEQMADDRQAPLKQGSAD